MAKFKDWLQGDEDLFNQEIPVNELSNIERIDKEVLEKSVSRKERRRIVHINTVNANFAFVVLSIITVVAYIYILLAMTSYLPAFGEIFKGYRYDYYFISNYYIENALADTKSINSVTGMILDYRAFDTLGESFVLFSAVTCVFILLQGSKEETEAHERKGLGMENDKIVRNVAAVIIPIVFVFGIYVVLNGHLSPGGGFSGGAILGAGLILFSLAYGDKVTQKFFSLKTFKTISSIALLGYSLVKCYSFLMGGMHVLFPTSNMWHDPISTFFHSFADGSILSGGYILILNICVGAVVACTMYAFYSLFKKGDI